MTEQQENNICGAETLKGGKCQNPAQSCPWHNENGERTQKSPGRKKKLPQIKNKLLEAAEKGTTKEGCARYAGIHESTLYDYLNENPEFEQEFKRARAKGEQKLMEKVTEKNPRFVLERSYDYTKSKADTEVNVNNQLAQKQESKQAAQFNFELDVVDNTGDFKEEFDEEEEKGEEETVES